MTWYFRSNDNMPFAFWCCYVLYLVLAAVAEDIPLEAGASSGELPVEDLDEYTPELYKRLYNFGLGKRAYSYQSEFKRLPVYNFGLGKRSPSMYSFGLGKRAPPSGLYSFGLGKRLGPHEMYSFGLGKRSWQYDYPEGELEEEYDADIEDGKRNNKLYSFGLGKRARSYSFGLGKRDPSRLYSFGLGKKSGMYDFGLGKRGMRDYGFGLGKRPSRLASKFNFGLGKRGSEDDDVSNEDQYWHNDDDNKRAEHRFAFGLGKREVTPQEIAAYKQEINNDDDKAAPKSENSTDHAPSTHTTGTYHLVKREEDASNYWVDEDEELEKRNPRYRFIGLGKKTSYDNRSPVRRMYNFGLGKRVPLYDFGVGKRSEPSMDH